jgi:DNA invertase Pin-like site-specific DNA recombinase
MPRSPAARPSSARTSAAAPSGRASAAQPAAPAKALTPAVLYARVSSADQAKEGFSIPAQQKLLRSYAEEKGYAIKEEFTDIETAKKAGRTSFTKMLAWLRKNKTCKVILVEKTDRLYRNLKDWVELDGMDLDIHLVKEGTVLSDASRSSEKFIHGIKVLMAKNYIDNLSEEVKKGMLEKAEQGIWPGPAPLGYLNVSRADGKRIVDTDPDRAASVKRLFEMYATGRYTLKELSKQAATMGLLSRKAQKPPQIAQLHLMLHNPLYKGEYLWRGTWYQGSHPSLVSPELWDRVQDIMAGRGTAHPAPQKHQFAFTGLVHCGVCAAEGNTRLLVGEIQRKKYIYYHCNACQVAGRKPRFVREEALSDTITAHLKGLSLDGPVVEWLKTALRGSHADKQQFHDAAVARLQKQYANLQRKLDLTYDDRLEGRLTLEQYEARANASREEMAHVRAELVRYETADRAYTEEGIALLELSSMALELYEEQDAPERRRLLDFLTLNTEFRDDRLVVKWRKPFDGLAESIEAAKAKGAAIDESSDAHQVWLPVTRLHDSVALPQSKPPLRFPSPPGTREAAPSRPPGI